MEKAKSIDSKNLLKKILINKETGYELDEKTLKEKYENTKVNYFDIGTQLINYQESKIRYIYDKEANVFFRAKDLCNILEYKNTTEAIRKHINAQDKFNYKNINSLTSATPLGNEDENTIYINETGLNSFLITSKQKQALKFRDWVCRDILPSIRKHGFFSLKNTFNLNEFDKRNCFYIFKGYTSFYKYGITNDIKHRMICHKSDGLLKDENMIKNIFILDNYNQLMNVENGIKKYIKNNGYFYEYEKYTELFKEECYDKIIGKIKHLISKNTIKDEANIELSVSEKNIEFLKLQNENLKLQLQQSIIEKEKKELELKIAEINKNKTIINSVSSNITINNQSNKCIDCNSDISQKAIRCNKCEHKYRFENSSSKKPSYDQLKKDKIKLKSNRAIARKYGVSDTSVRKWFKKYEKYN